MAAADGGVGGRAIVPAGSGSDAVAELSSGVGAGGSADGGAEGGGGLGACAGVYAGPSLVAEAGGGVGVIVIGRGDAGALLAAAGAGGVTERAGYSGDAGGRDHLALEEMLERLPLTPVLCILYAGHNDNTRSFPGQTIAGLMRGDVPVVQQFVAPVSLQEAQENVRAMVSKCGQLWVIPEYSKQLEAEQVAYGAALAAVPGVTLLDAASRLRAMPVEWMLDDVHPSPEGQGVLAAYVLEQLAQRKPELLKP